MARVSESGTLAPIDEGSRSVSRLSGIESELHREIAETERGVEI